MRAIVTGQIDVDKGPYLQAVHASAKATGDDLMVCQVWQVMHAEGPDAWMRSDFRRHYLTTFALWIAMLILCGGVICSSAKAANPSAAAANSAPAVATPDQLQQLLDKGQYSELLSKLKVALAAKTAETDKSNRYALLMLKGEALIHTGADESAADVFKAAAMVGTADHDIAIARANASLARRSTLNKYQPRTKVAGAASLPATIDIVEAGNRKLAFVALFTDLVTPAKPQVEKAEKMTTLPPILEVATQLADIRPLEIAGTGADTDSKALLEKLGRQASNLMNAALKNLDVQVSTVTKRATARQKQERLKGSDLSDALLPDDVTNLDGIITQATQIGTTAVSMQTTFGDADNFKSIETDAQKTIDSVNKLLKQYKHSAAN